MIYRTFNSFDVAEILVKDKIPSILVAVNKPYAPILWHVKRRFGVVARRDSYGPRCF